MFKLQRDCRGTDFFSGQIASNKKEMCEYTTTRYMHDIYIYHVLHEIPGYMHVIVHVRTVNAF